MHRFCRGVGIIRTKACGLIALVVLGGAGAAQAQTYPSKTITMVVTAAAGGVTDVVARAIGQRLARTGDSRS